MSGPDVGVKVGEIQPAIPAGGGRQELSQQWDAVTEEVGGDDEDLFISLW